MTAGEGGKGPVRATPLQGMAAADLFGDLQKAELSRSLRQSDFLRAVRAGAPVGELEAIKADLDALTELASAALARVQAEIHGHRASPTPAPGAGSGG